MSEGAFEIGKSKLESCLLQDTGNHAATGQERLIRHLAEEKPQGHPGDGQSGWPIDYARENLGEISVADRTWRNAIAGSL